VLCQTGDCASLFSMSYRRYGENRAGTKDVDGGRKREYLDDVIAEAPRSVWLWLCPMPIFSKNSILHLRSTTMYAQPLYLGCVHTSPFPNDPGNTNETAHTYDQVPSIFDSDGAFKMAT
jgi:hypothetical protein